ncbi:formate dehydrogenase subunit gamma [Xenophilus azovorans]|uniref:formate dehydrogenase subunit gamma n=1 Tax=Xenophilus azovorans TaxID=151755 RepID=UPI000A05D98A|nr:formate dehydrogenase subunit gamma [Xenophilus azovorans]
MTHPDLPPARKETLLATPDELRDRLRQLGKSSLPADDPRRAAVQEIVAAHAGQPGALLPILHGVQDALGFIPPVLVGDIAEALNLSRAEVHGVVSFYHHFRSSPAGRHVLEVCRAESCRSMGSEALWAHACDSLGLPAEGGTTPDGAVTLQPVYCLGLCAQSPSIALDGQPRARMSAARLDALVARSVVDEVAA